MVFSITKNKISIKKIFFIFAFVDLDYRWIVDNS